MASARSRFLLPRRAGTTRRTYYGTIALLEDVVQSSRAQTPDCLAARYSSLGKAYYFSGRREEAVGAFQKAVEYGPTNPMSHMWLGWAHYLNRKLPEAIRAFGEAIRLQPNDAAAHFWRGRAALAAKQYMDSQSAFGEARRLAPEAAIPQFWLCRAAFGPFRRLAYLRAPSPTDYIAIDCRAVAEGLALSILAKPRFAAAHYWFGRACYLAGRNDEAIAALEEVAKYLPNNALGKFWLARAYLSAARYDDAKRCLEEAVKRDEQRPLYWFWLGRALLRQGDCDAAIEAFETAAQDCRIYPDAHFWLGRALLRNERYQMAIGVLTEALEARATARRRFWLGRAYLAAGQHNLAAECFEAIMAAESEKYLPNDILGRRDAVHALGNYGTDYVINPHYTARPLVVSACYSLGQLYFERAEYQSALNAFGFCERLNFIMRSPLNLPTADICLSDSEKRAITEMAASVTYDEEMLSILGCNRAELTATDAMSLFIKLSKCVSRLEGHDLGLLPSVVARLSDTIRSLLKQPIVAARSNRPVEGDESDSPA